MGQVLRACLDESGREEIYWYTLNWSAPLGSSHLTEKMEEVMRDEEDFLMVNHISQINPGEH